MAGRLEGKRCLIVGGTTGLGYAAASRFLEEGARLVIAGRSDAKGRDAADELGKVGTVRFVPCDASQAGQVAELFRNAVHSLGGLDVLYHVAGISGRRHGDGPLHECTDDGWTTTIAANLTSVFLTNRAALGYWTAEGRPGSILNMASVLAFAPSPHFFDTAAYAASKGGIIALSKQAAARFAAQGVRINVIAPSLIDTPMAARACQDEAILSFLRTKQPLSGGPGRPEDCADAAVFLCSDEARFITGIVLTADGGWSISDGQYSPGS